MADAACNEGSHCRLVIVVLLLILLLPLQTFCQQSTTKKLYVVYLGDKQHEDPEQTTASHHDMLTAILGRQEPPSKSNYIYALISVTVQDIYTIYSCISNVYNKEEAHDSMIYSYKHGFSGFSAMLTESQAQEIAELPEVHSIRPSILHPLHTTRSQDFLGLDYTQSAGLLHDTNYGDSVIIGIIDSGIWPESPSFKDDGLGPLPSKWKGKCLAGQAFGSNQCNRKIIGARWYDKHLNPDNLKGQYKSARDADGHGTHVASTAAGVLVPNVSFHGLAVGYARGAAPRARLAVYKACWGSPPSCDTAAVLQAFDDAIHDGVDVLSLSIGAPGLEYPASLQAVKNGISVIFSAGNEGPAPRTVKNASPWAMSVASATIDRAFPTVITLSDSTSSFVGQSLFYDTDDKIDNCCLFGTPETSNVTLAVGKIVLCNSPNSVSLISPTIQPEAGAKGIIFAAYAFDILDVVESCGSMPCVLVDFEVAQQIKQSADENTALVVKVAAAQTWIGGEVLAPKISAFSSRGPSPLYPEFLKPDIAAPGSNILAAVQDSYKFMSGTSMACPHVSGVVALLKALHPDWSPAIIKSALVTTASNEKYGVPILADGLPQKIADPFDYGGGFIDPNRAVDPGLAYDVDPNDYTLLLDCISAANSSFYKAVVKSPPGMKISVEPSVLQFSQSKKKQSFKVIFSMTRKFQGGYLFGSLAWYDGGTHYVRIPIAVRPIVSDNYADL
uniref:Subtilisin-like protease n=1 Tax=Oryza rufipogon TaxID=4529 RepID=A0A0E0P4S5_ORYRU